MLRDDAYRSEVVVVPSLGGACIAFRIGRWAVLAEPPDDEALVARTSRYGIPVLYPWPNRVAHGQFLFDGRSIEVPTPTPGAHANHGLVRSQRWEVVDVGSDAGGAWVRSRVAVEHPAFPSVLTVEHRLVGRALHISATAENVGAQPMPMGFGLHPYFDVTGSRPRWTVQVPASHAWELDGFIPTGRSIPVEGRLDLRDFRPLDDEAWDDVFTGLVQPHVATVRDPVSERTIAVRSGPGFREHVVYAPLDRPVVCLEPYTCPTDAFNLAARGIDAGVVVLGPGDRWQGAIAIEASLPDNDPALSFSA